MSDVINGVPRELLERVLEGLDKGFPLLKAAEELRVLLTAQPQASAEIPFAGFDPNFCPGSNPDNPQTEEEEPEQASAAQSAPAELLPCPFCGGSDIDETSNGVGNTFFYCGECGSEGPASETLSSAYDAWNNRAWQRTQSVPAGERETIRAVFLRNGFTVKEGQTDLKPYVYAAAEELLSIARAAWQCTQPAPVVPVQKLIDGLDEITALSLHLRQGGCDSTDLPGLEEGLTHAVDMAAEMLSMLAAAPAQPAAHDQGEVQRLREALRELRASLDPDDWIGEVRMIDFIDAALAASTGQEVKP